MGINKYTEEDIFSTLEAQKYLQATKYHPGTRKASEAHHVDTRQQLGYFNNNKCHAKVSTYDRTFHVTEGYCSKLKRDDLQHTQVKLMLIITSLWL